MQVESALFIEHPLKKRIILRLKKHSHIIGSSQSPLICMWDLLIPNYIITNSSSKKRNLCKLIQHCLLNIHSKKESFFHRISLLPSLDHHKSLDLYVGLVDSQLHHY